MVKNLVKKGLSAFVAKQTNIFSAASFIVLTTIFSQVLGIVKRRLIISYFGATSDPGVFEAAFRIPDFLMQLLIVAAITSAFMPLFTDFVSEEKKKANLFASQVINIGIFVYFSLAIVVVIFPDFFSKLAAPGFSPSEISLMASLMRIILVSQLFFIVGLVVSAILQSYHHFLIPGIASSFYNIGIIAGTILLAPTIGIFGVTVGVMIGSFLFVLVQLPLLRKVDFEYYPILRFDEGVRKLIKLMIPRSGVLLIGQIAISANVIFASFATARNLFLYDLAQTLMMATVFLFGQSIAQASFPSLSQKKNDEQGFMSIFISSFYQILYLTLPISVLLIVLRIPIVRLIYGASNFDWAATVITGKTLAFLAISISAQALVALLTRAFYARKETKTPLYITCISVLVSIVLSYFFILQLKMPIYYLALANSIGSIISLMLSIYFFNFQISLPKLDMSYTISKIVFSSLVMGVFLYVPIKLLDQLIFDTTRTINLIILTGISFVIGLSSYLFLTWFLEIREATYILNVVKRLGDWRKIIGQIDEPIDGSTKLNP